MAESGRVIIPRDINDSRLVVGSSLPNTGGFTHFGDPLTNCPEEDCSRAFLFGQGQMYDLNDLLEPNMAKDWTLTHANAINNRGQIVGTGFHKGVLSPFLLDPFKRVQVQPIQVRKTDYSDPATVNWYGDVTDKIWDQADIRIEFLPLTVLADDDLLKVDLSERTDLYNSIDPDATAIYMWFVDEIVDPNFHVFGVANPRAGGIFISESVHTNNRIDTVAHELAHVLLQSGHVMGDNKNLLADGGVRLIPSSLSQIAPDGAMLDVLTATQISTARDSEYADDVVLSFLSSSSVPEPATQWMFAIIVVLMWRRRPELVTRRFAIAFNRRA